MNYCRKCDVAFCSVHLDCHDLCSGTPTPDFRAEFCSVCGGIWRCEAKEVVRPFCKVCNQVMFETDGYWSHALATPETNNHKAELKEPRISEERAA